MQAGEEVQDYTGVFDGQKLGRITFNLPLGESYSVQKAIKQREDVPNL